LSTISRALVSRAQPRRRVATERAVRARARHDARSRRGASGAVDGPSAVVEREVEPAHASVWLRKRQAGRSPAGGSGVVASVEQKAPAAVPLLTDQRRAACPSWRAASGARSSAMTAPGAAHSP